MAVTMLMSVFTASVYAIEVDDTAIGAEVDILDSAASNARALTAINELQKKEWYKIGSNIGTTQCFGFAASVFKSLFGKTMGTQTSATKITSDTMTEVGRLLGAQSNESIKNLLMKAYPGDVIQYSSTTTAIHAAVIKEVNNSGITLYHAYGGGSGTWYVHEDYLPWSIVPTSNGFIGSFTSNSHGIGLYHSKNYDEMFGNFENLGSDFYAHITTTSNHYLAVSADSTNNVLLSTLTYSNYQEWRFQKDSDNAYKITNVKTGTCLDVKGGKAEKGTNIQVYASNNSNAQRWYILKNGTGYRLVPKADTSTTMDVKDGTIASGTNIQIWDNQNTSDAQRFTITKTTHSTSNLGQRFTANIISSVSELPVAANDSGNVFIDSASGDGYQEWLFERQEDNSYEIKNVKLNKCLDVYNRETANGTNIQVYNDNNSMAQRWYMMKDGKDYYFVPKINVDGAMDIAGGTLTKGTNIQEYKRNSTDAQKFYLDYLDCTPKYTKESNGHRYEYYDLNTTWQLSEKFCERKGGHLVTVTSEAENELVHNMINKNAWLGGTNFGADTRWYHVNGESMTYTNWRQGEPSNGSEHCMVMYYSGDYAKQWNDVNETQTTGFVCEYDDIVDPERFSPMHTLSVGEKRYEVYEDGVDWQTAKAVCEKKGGNLVVINDAQENDDITELIQNSSKDELWIGFIDINREGVWKDVFGNQLSYTNWAQDEPNNSLHIEDYALIKKADGKWNDFKGFGGYYHSMGFICEYDVSEQTVEYETIAPSETAAEETVEPPIPFPTEEPDPEILGDADGDGTVGSIDVTQIMRYVAQIDTGIDEGVLMNADVDGNGVLEIIDATYIQRYLANIETPYKIGETV